VGVNELFELEAAHRRVKLEELADGGLRDKETIQDRGGHDSCRELTGCC